MAECPTDPVLFMVGHTPVALYLCGDPLSEITFEYNPDATNCDIECWQAYQAPCPTGPNTLSTAQRSIVLVMPGHYRTTDPLPDGVSISTVDLVGLPEEIIASLVCPPASTGNGVSLVDCAGNLVDEGAHVPLCTQLPVVVQGAGVTITPTTVGTGDTQHVQYTVAADLPDVVELRDCEGTLIAKFAAKLIP